MLQIEIDNDDRLQIKVIHECLDNRVCAQASQTIDFGSKTNRNLQMDVSSVNFADSRGLELICKLARVFRNFELIGVSRRLKNCLSKLPLNRRPAFSELRPEIAAQGPRLPRTAERIPMATG